MESESVMITPLYFEQNTKKNYCLSEESQLQPGSLYVTSPYLLLNLESWESEYFQRHTEVSKSCSFNFGFGITSMGKEQGVSAWRVPLN